MHRIIFYRPFIIIWLTVEFFTLNLLRAKATALTTMGGTIGTKTMQGKQVVGMRIGRLIKVRKFFQSFQVFSGQVVR